MDRIDCLLTANASRLGPINQLSMYLMYLQILFFKIQDPVGRRKILRDFW